MNLAKIGKLLIFVVLVSLVLYGCSSETQPVVSQQQIPVNLTEVYVIPSCDDNNICTDDVFNNVTQQCEYVRQATCCGDGVCDFNERCDLTAHKTKCSQDCIRECPAFLQFSNWECSGSCFNTGSYYIIDGNAVFKSTLTNIGEMSLNNIKARFNCAKEDLSSIFYNEKLSTEKSGVIIKNYFSNNTTSVSLSGESYAKNQVEYTFEIIGKPTSDMNLICTVILSTADGFYSSYDFNLHLRIPA